MPVVVAVVMELIAKLSGLLLDETGSCRDESFGNGIFRLLSQEQDEDFWLAAASE